MKLLRSCYINVVKTKKPKKKTKFGTFLQQFLARRRPEPHHRVNDARPHHRWGAFHRCIHGSRTAWVCIVPHMYTYALQLPHMQYTLYVCVRLCLCVCERICNKKLLLNARCQLTTDTQLCLLLRLHMPRRYRKKIMLQCVHHAHHIYYLQDIVFRY